jgi:3-hydroxyisobutyrate dehydrogenase-like beta-hydroxyacid dehydrogenase
VQREPEEARRRAVLAGGAVNVAFLGLGTMGSPMAGHLVRAGHDVRVWNRTAAKAEAWATAHRGTTCPNVADAVRDAAIVVSCVGRDDDVRAVTRAGFPAMRPGAVWVDHTTTSATLARERAADAETRGLAFVDAPVSGGQSGAEQGVLTVMGGGTAGAWAVVEPVLAAYARKAVLVGPSGHGQLAKMVNQVCIGGLIEALAEAVLFAEQAGLDVPAVFDAIGQGAARSWQLENRWRTMLEGRYDFGFAVDWMRKDLGIVADEAQRLGLELPVTRLVDGYYAEVQALGGGRWDTSSLVERLRQATVRSRTTKS